jgi:hypothetical protein
MMSISDTLSHHRATRDRYMAVAYDARRAHRDAWPRGVPTPALHYVTQKYVMVPRAVDSLAALRCFLRHARAANRKLVQVKRLQRTLASPNNWNGWI